MPRSERVHFTAYDRDDASCRGLAPPPRSPSPAHSLSPSQAYSLGSPPLAHDQVLGLHSYFCDFKGQIIFDLSAPMFHITAPSELALDEPTTTPPVRHTDFNYARLPWMTSVVARRQSFVTVRDVFEALYTAMRKPVTATEFSQLPTTAARNKVTWAFDARCERAGRMERQKGVRRIDFLGGDTMFRASMIVQYEPRMRLDSSTRQSAKTRPRSMSKDVKSERQIDARDAKRPSDEASQTFRESSFAKPETESRPQGREDSSNPLPEPYPATYRPSTSGKSDTNSGETDKTGQSTPSTQHQSQPRGSSMFSGAQNTIINDGHFVACESAEITIHTTCTAHHDSPEGSPQARSVPGSILLAFPATFGAVQAPAMLPHEESTPSGLMRYRPLYYEDLPVLFAPLLFVYLWRFVFGYHSPSGNV